MSRKDVLSKNYIGQKEVFADLVNLALFCGKEVVKAEKVIELDSSIKMKRRDLLRRCILQKRKELIVGIENQSVVDPSMPIRVLCYDAEIYERQIEEKRKENKGKGLKGGEYLSGIRFTDRLDPVITIVLNLSEERWCGPRDVKEMLHSKEIVNGYEIRVIEPRELTEEKLKRCKSEVWKFLQVLKYYQEEEKMIECLKRKEYEEVGEETAKMIEEFVGIKTNHIVKEGKVNMCRVMESYTKKCRLEGKKEGERMGVEKGKKEEKLHTAKRMLETGLTEEVILKCCLITKKELKVLMENTVKSV